MAAWRCAGAMEAVYVVLDMNVTLAQGELPTMPAGMMSIAMHIQHHKLWSCA